MAPTDSAFSEFASSHLHICSYIETKFWTRLNRTSVTSPIGGWSNRMKNFESSKWCVEEFQINCQDYKRTDTRERSAVWFGLLRMYTKCVALGSLDWKLRCFHPTLAWNCICGGILPFTASSSFTISKPLSPCSSLWTFWTIWKVLTSKFHSWTLPTSWPTSFITLHFALLCRVQGNATRGSMQKFSLSEPTGTSISTQVICAFQYPTFLLNGSMNPAFAFMTIQSLMSKSWLEKLRSLGRFWPWSLDERTH